MKVYTFSQARQNFASILEEAKREGEVRIKRKDGTVYSIRPVQKKESPLDVEGVDLSLTAEEIVAAIREIRER